MILKIYSTYDAKVKAFHPPLAFRNSGEATRWFTDMSNDPKSNLCRYPEDYSLFETGEFNDESGLIIQYEAKLPLGSALQYKENNNVTHINQ